MSEHKDEHQFHTGRKHRPHGSSIDRLNQFHHGRTHSTEHKAEEAKGIKHVKT